MNDDFKTIRSALKIATVQRAGEQRPEPVALVIPEVIDALNRIEHKLIRLRAENMAFLSVLGNPVQINLTVNAKKVKGLEVDKPRSEAQNG